MSSPRTPLDAFRQHGAELAKNITIFHVPSSEIASLRQWLDDAPSHAKTQDMARWGKLMLCLVDAFDKNNDWVEDTQGDTRRLASYLHAMASLPAKDWEPPSFVLLAGTNKISPYEAFHQVARALGPKQPNHGQVLFRELLSSGQWQPDALVCVLDGLRANTEEGFVIPMRDTAQGLLFQALWPRMQDTAWRPADTPLYGHMWSASHMGASIEDAGCAALLAKSTPSQTGRMLDALLQSTNIAPEAIAPFFPLQVSTCDAYSVLEPLIGLLTEGGRDDPTYKANIVAEELNRHNPELSNLVQMHLTLFPEACESSTLATLLVPGFDALYQRPVEPAMAFPGDFFAVE